MWRVLSVLWRHHREAFRATWIGEQPCPLFRTQCWRKSIHTRPTFHANWSICEWMEAFCHPMSVPILCDVRPNKKICFSAKLAVSSLKAQSSILGDVGTVGWILFIIHSDKNCCFLRRKGEKLPIQLNRQSGRILFYSGASLSRSLSLALKANI